MDRETVQVTHSCSAIIENTKVEKKEDPGTFTMSCTIGMYKYEKAFRVLGDSINLMPYVLY